MKEKILKLRAEGMSYRQIQKELGCSRSLVSYYVNPLGKQKNLDRQNKNRFRRRVKFKMSAGGKCSKCGYNKCLDALQFHHTNVLEKRFEIADAIFGHGDKTDEQIEEEIKKCVLVCANCHCELHATNTFLE